MESNRCDVMVVGASLGGTAAAMRAAAMGATVILVEETEWIGGQLTAQGVCTPDENRWIERSGGTASYLALRARIRDHYRGRHNLSASGLQQPHFNPGSCWVSRISVEPLVARRILEEMLAAQASLEVRLNTRVVEVERRIDRVAGVILESGTGRQSLVQPQFVLDATELGALLPMAGVDHVLGAESHAETGEPDAPEGARPDWIQPFTVPFALELRPRGEDHTIPEPPHYAKMKALQKYHVRDGAMRGMWGELGWWTYRRVLAAENFAATDVPFDVAMINTASNDFRGGTVPTDDPTQDPVAAARLASLGYVRWLQTECPRTEEPGALGYPELKLRGDWFGTEDGLAPSPYIRESRRIKAHRTILEHDVVAADSAGRTWQAGLRAAFFADSCGIGHYWLDIHDGGTDEPSRFLETRPFQIPLGALIPIKVENLLAACKNLGVTHLTNGCCRLHPIEWNVGESAGALAAYCARRGIVPRAVWESKQETGRYQNALLDAGIPLYWWTDLPPAHPAWRAAQRLAIDGIWPGGDSLEFRPDDPFTVEPGEHPGEFVAGLEIPDSIGSRGEAAAWLLTRLYPG